MASQLFPILVALVLLSAQGPLSVEAWDSSLVANYGDSCSGLFCDQGKNMVCSRTRVCECDVDPVTGNQLEYNEDEDTCIQVERESDPSPTAKKSEAQVQYGGKPGHDHGNQYGGAEPEIAQAVSRIEGSYCRRHEECHVTYGQLAACLFQFNYCYCHAFKQETGFHNGQCHNAVRLGQPCEYTVQCMLGHNRPGTPHPVCRTNPDYRNERVCTEGTASGTIASITLILFGIFANKFITNI